MSQFKAFADYKMNVNENLNSVFGRVENIGEQGRKLSQDTPVPQLVVHGGGGWGTGGNNCKW